MKKQLIIFLSLLISMGVFAQPHQHHKTQNDQMDHSMMDHSGHGDMSVTENTAMTYSVSSSFQAQLKEVVKVTQELNESFVEGNSSKVSSSARLVANSIKEVDMSLLKQPEAHMEWMMNLKELNSSLNDIAESRDIGAQRTAFVQFNQALYRSIKSFGIGEQAFYQHCPMAMNNQGAYWISNNQEIRNPYFGNSMMSCGSTKEILN